MNMNEIGKVPTVIRSGCELTGTKSARLANRGPDPGRNHEKFCASMKIWIDLDNTPHVPFFKPIVRELEKRGYTIVLTARDAFQVCELATRFGLSYTTI